MTGARGQRWARAALLTGLAAVGGVGAACGDDDDDAPSGSTTAPASSSAAASPASSAAAAQTGVAAAMASVPATDASRTYFEWGDVDGLYAAAGAERPAEGFDLDALGRWGRIVGFGAGHLVSSALQLEEQFGIAPLRASQLVTVGVPPAQAVRLDGGQDAERIRAALLDAGLQETTSPAGTPLLAAGEEGQVDLESPFAQLGVLTALNRVALRDDDLAGSGTGAGVDGVLGGSPSLLDDPAHGAIARCLGDALVVIVSGEEEVRGANGAQLLAVGVAAGEGGEPVNVVCSVGDAAGASAREQALRTAVDPATIDLATNAPVGEQVESATVTTSTEGDLALARAELQLTADAPAGYVIDRLFRSGYAFWLGGSVPGQPETGDTAATG